MYIRQQALQHWLGEKFASDNFHYQALTGDASFRRYFRLNYQNKNYIIMDAPPEREPLDAFIFIAKLLKSHGLHTPTIHAVDQKLGFLLLEDFGDDLLLNQLNDENAENFYKDALNQLILMQKCPALLPSFDETHIMQELNLFNEWFLKKYLDFSLTVEDEAVIQSTFQLLSQEILKQPQVFIHRDYHSRNIMVTPKHLGIIDFQDAMLGPFSYDLVSLLKDCYIVWPRSQILAWVDYFYNNSTTAQQWTQAEFIRAFDYCGMQRHLKVLGIFCRLFLRDDKPNYLNDLPLTLNYLKDCVKDYPEFVNFYALLQRIELP